uniref:Uncharacterized protein n=1 Tax=Calcidiscus leptoporus TaxID=127549 RepID=A0A7S0NR41_9EUKA
MATLAPPMTATALQAILPSSMRAETWLLISAATGCRSLAALPLIVADALQLRPASSGMAALQTECEVAEKEWSEGGQEDGRRIFEGFSVSTGVGASATALQVSLAGSGACAELRLRTGGSAPEDTLLCAVAAVLEALPDGLSVSFCFAAHPLLRALARAVAALSRELAATASACESFLLRTADERRHGRQQHERATSAGAAWAAEMAKLQSILLDVQSATDEHLAGVHAITAARSGTSDEPAGPRKTGGSTTPEL